MSNKKWFNNFALELINFDTQKVITFDTIFNHITFRKGITEKDIVDVNDPEQFDGNFRDDKLYKFVGKCSIVNNLVRNFAGFYKHSVEFYINDNKIEIGIISFDNNKTPRNNLELEVYFRYFYRDDKAYIKEKI